AISLFSIRAWPRRRAIGESSDALLVIFTTWLAPATPGPSARRALSINIELLCWNRWTHKHYARDAFHRHVNALRNGEIAFDNVDAGVRQRGRLRRVMGQDADGNAALCEQARRFRAHLAGGGYEDHGALHRV